MIKRLSMVLMGLVVLASCASSEVDIGVETLYESKKDKLLASHVLPQYVIEDRKPRIAIVPLLSNKLDASLLKNCLLKKSLVEQANKILSVSESYDVVSKHVLHDLSRNFHFPAVLEGDDDGRQLKQQLASWANKIDYIVLLTVVEAQSKADATKSNAGFMLCDEKVKMVMQVRVIPLGSTQLSARFNHVLEASGVAAESYEVGFPATCDVRDVCGMLGLAMGRAFDELREEVLNVTSVYGVITRVRSNQRARVASLSLGKKDGLKNGMLLDVVRFEPDKQGQKERVLARCKVYKEGLLDEQATCVVQGEHADTVKINHAVVFKHKKSSLRKLKSGMNWLEGELFGM